MRLLEPAGDVERRVDGAYRVEQRQIAIVQSRRCHADDGEVGDHLTRPRVEIGRSGLRGVAWIQREKRGGRPCDPGEVRDHCDRLSGLRVQTAMISRVNSSDMVSKGWTTTSDPRWSAAA